MTTKQKVLIHSQAPTRIDLAGGTLDIWPLYLFLQKPITLNLGISLFAEASLEITPTESGAPGEVLLQSSDQSKELRLTWEQVQAEITPPPTLELHFKLLSYFLNRRFENGVNNLNFDLKLTTLARSPAGAGLGGSSTLSIAIVGALATWASFPEQYTPFDPEVNGTDYIEIVRDVESTVIQVPAGLQDYYGAMYGSLQSLRWGPGTHGRKRLPEAIIPELEDRLLLFYSGQSRNSGINNWVMFKSFIDRTADIRQKFQTIATATQSLETALLTKDWIRVGQAIDEEWTVRKTLAPGITTPEIDRAFEKAGKLTPIAGKVCGAGGGGCFFVYLSTSDPKERTELRQHIQKIFAQEGIQALPFHTSPHGLEVRVTRA